MRSLNEPGRSPVHGMQAMACTSQTLSTQVAIDVLKAGGNALDAAIAASAMQCVVEPGSTSIGGDCFVMYSKGGTGAPLAFNGSGRAPAAATAAAIKQSGATSLERDSAHSVIVPGAVDAWIQLHRDHGSMPFAELLAPAIEAARTGFPIASRNHYDFSAARDFLLTTNRSKDIYLHNGEAPAVGSVLKLPQLANVLEAIAKEGSDVFYRGEYATEMVEELQSLGGLHTLDDFARVSGNYVEPISANYRDQTVYQCPPNGQGVIALLMLNMMSRIKKDPGGPLTPERIHTELEACRLAYGARAGFLADPDLVDVPVEKLLSEEYASKLCSLIDPTAAIEGVPVTELPPHNDTVYISVVDKDRNVCSFINTLYWAFGSGITTKSGITLTNRGMGFVLDESSPNCIAPNKRPLHTIIPAMTYRNGKVDLCFGVMGGEYQAMGHQQFLTRYLDYGCDIQQAMDLPRYMVNPRSGEIELEDGLDQSIRNDLLARGHKIADGEFVIGGSQAIAIDWDNGVLTGGSDPRKDGCAMGY